MKTFLRDLNHKLTKSPIFNDPSKAILVARSFSDELEETGNSVSEIPHRSFLIHHIKQKLNQASTDNLTEEDFKHLSAIGEQHEFTWPHLQRFTKHAHAIVDDLSKDIQPGTLFFVDGHGDFNKYKESLARRMKHPDQKSTILRFNGQDFGVKADGPNSDLKIGDSLNPLKLVSPDELHAKNFGYDKDITSPEVRDNKFALYELNKHINIMKKWGSIPSLRSYREYGTPKVEFGTPQYPTFRWGLEKVFNDHMEHHLSRISHDRISRHIVALAGSKEHFGRLIDTLTPSDLKEDQTLREHIVFRAQNSATKPIFANSVQDVWDHRYNGVYPPDSMREKTFKLLKDSANDTQARSEKKLYK